MRILVCIDDTDSIDSRGTGALAESIAQAIEEYGWGKSYRITRHQLLIHDDIPYTSHNSSMCFEAQIRENNLQSIIDYASDFLKRESASGSDPGLCVVVLDSLSDREGLIAFGRKAKQSVLTKEKAYTLANRLGIHLSEHGGNGQGIIGALAGAGLRLSGNDGRFKGWINLNSTTDVVTVKELCSHAHIDTVRTLDGITLNDDEQVLLGDKVKTVLLEGQAVLLVSSTITSKDEVTWQTCTKQQLKKY